MASLQRKRLFALAKYIAEESSVSISVHLNNSCMDVVWMYETYTLQEHAKSKTSALLVVNVWFVSGF